MFTGIIETVGTLVRLDKSGDDRIMVIDSHLDLSTTRVGDSIAVSGVCLTVVAFQPGQFQVQVSAETVARTRFAHIQTGARVNLERALAITGRLDGHMVQGHVDAVGHVEQILPRGRSLTLWFRVPGDVGRYIVPKGAIALDGVSLTVNEVHDGDRATRFSINVIPHTQNQTTLAHVAIGHMINVETDIVGRYVERLLKKAPTCPSPRIDAAFLKDNGFV